MRIRRKFLQLTKQTVPYNTEDKLFKYLPKGIKKDKFGNYYYTVGSDFTTMFTCHLDTACSYEKKVNHVQTKDTIKTDGKTILGADDKAGMVVILYMISKKVPGLYYFFIGEEVGCIGSNDLSTDFNWPDIKKVVSFDRRGTTSVITEQLYGRCCSDEFATSLSNLLNSTGMGLCLSPDDTGLITDSAQFVDLVPECTNISVGYYNEHTTNEIQDIDYLTRLCRACTLIDWESLPIVRDPSEISEYAIPGWDDYPDLDCWPEVEYTESNFVYIFGDDGNIRKMYISNDWIDREISELNSTLRNIGYFPKDITWDGRECWCDEGDGHRYIGTRSDIINLIDDFLYIPYLHLKDDINKCQSKSEYKKAMVYAH